VASYPYVTGMHVVLLIIPRRETRVFGPFKTGEDAYNWGCEHIADVMKHDRLSNWGWRCAPLEPTALVSDTPTPDLNALREQVKATTVIKKEPK
jgi:hypothetical protein